MAKFAAPVFSGKGLSGTDGAAQAGMTRLKDSQPGRLEEAVLIARFASSYVLCDGVKSCCTGRKPNDEWTHAIAVLS